MFANKRLLFAVLALLLAPLVIGAFLSKDWEATGRVDLELDPEEVFTWLESAKHWHEWNQASEESPVPFRVEFSSPTHGVGSKVYWSHERHGKGVLEVVEIDPGRRVKVVVTPEGGTPLYSEVLFEAQSSQPAISRRDWSVFSGLGPLGGYVAWIAEQAGRTRIAKSLGCLEAEVKRRSASDAGAELESAELESDETSGVSKPKDGKPRD